MPRQIKTDKALDRRVELAYYASCNGIQIDIMKIGSVFAAGRRAIAEGADDEQLKLAIRSFVDQIRVS